MVHREHSISDFLHSIRRVDNELDAEDRPLSQREYDRRRRPTDPYSGIANDRDRFDGWDHAKELAGVELTGPATTKEEGLDALKRAAELSEGKLSTRDYREHKRPEDPSADTLFVNWGWNDLKREAGLELHYPNRSNLANEICPYCGSEIWRYQTHLPECTQTPDNTAVPDGGST